METRVLKVTLPPNGKEFKKVPGYNIYYVNKEGEVWSIRGSGRILKQYTNKRGYRTVSLSNGHEKKTHMVHQLVLLTFVGARPRGMMGCHTDGNALNNRLSNLRWDTPSSNSIDTVTHGTHRNARKTSCKRGHPFTDDNLKIDSYGRRICIECRRMYDRNRVRK